MSDLNKLRLDECCESMKEFPPTQGKTFSI